jgi:peroxiredoxin
MPELVRAYAEHKDKGLVVLAIDVRESEAEIQGFAREFGMTFPILLDRTGQVATAYRMTGLPQSYFVDKSGVVREAAIGPMDKKSLDQKLATITGG